MAAAVASNGGASRHDDSFRSIFPAVEFSLPTPETTPNIGSFASPGRSFGGFNIPTRAGDDVLNLGRAWSTTTRFLKWFLDGKLSRQHKQQLLAIQEAVALICNVDSQRNELIAWYSHEISFRFRASFLHRLHQWQQPVPPNVASRLVLETIDVLQDAQANYLSVFELIEPASPAFSDQYKAFQEFFARSKENLHAQFLNALPKRRLREAIFLAIFEHLDASLKQNGDPRACSTANECSCSVSLDTLPLAAMANTGFGGAEGVQIFVHALTQFLGLVAIRRPCFAVDWSRRTTVVPRLRRWIADRLAPTMERSLLVLEGTAEERPTDDFKRLLVEMAMRKFGDERTQALFDYIKTWPNSQGAVLDIKEFLHYIPSEKANVCSSFATQTKRRLLHSGASTSEILSMYINVIYAFRLLDPRGVLLEKVAGPMRNYLRNRDDAVAITAASFLADVDENGSTDSPGVCVEIALEVANSALQDGRNYRLLNFADMDWVPDPIDAAADYKASRSEDIIDYILSLFDQEDFIKEITKVLAQRLLETTDTEYVKELRLVELLKSRKLDTSKLQAAEVMLKDVRDSISLTKRINPHARYRKSEPPQPKAIQAAIPREGISMLSLYQLFEHRMTAAEFHATLHLVAVRRGELYFPKRVLRSQYGEQEPNGGTPEEVDYSVQVLSSFFWPQMRTNDFHLPPILAKLDESFSQRFAELGNQRKLHFRRALARVTVDLELEDRTVHEEEVPAWRASVIDAFTEDRRRQNAENSIYDPEEGMTVDQLIDELGMEEELVRDALRFWVGKQVLYQVTSGVYAVLESLNMDTGRAQQPQSQNENISAVVSHDAVLRESAPMFEAFIINMLQNGGEKEVGGFMGITNTMKMVLPAFSYGDEEVKWLLGEMEKKGQVSRSGDLWGVAR